MSTVLEREEYVEQAYFFRTFPRTGRRQPAFAGSAGHARPGDPDDDPPASRRPVPGDGDQAQRPAGHGLRALARTTSIRFRRSSFARPKTRSCRFSMDTALLVLEREATYRASNPTRPGLFVYQFETICRNRLGYWDGLTAMSEDPLLRRRLEGVSDRGSQGSRRRRFRRPDLLPLRPRGERTAAAEPELPAVRPYALRREGGENRQGEPRPRPALLVRGPAAAAQLPRSPATKSER